MEIEGEILGFVLIFLVVSAGFYFFIIRDDGSDEANPDAADNGTTDSPVNGSDANLTTTEDTGDVANETNQTMSFDNIDLVHWDHMPLTYGLVNNGSDCEEFSFKRMEEAFEIIEKESNFAINFTRTESNVTDIEVTCFNYQEAIEELKTMDECIEVALNYQSAQFSGYEVLEENVFVTELRLDSKNDTHNIYQVCYVNVGSVNPSFDMDLLLESKPVVENGVIVRAKKTIYADASGRGYCSDFPAKEVHDVLHLFGFDHIETPTFHEDYGWHFGDSRYFRDIMFPYPYCAHIKEMGSNYGECLQYIYTNGEMGEGCAAVNFIE